MVSAKPWKPEAIVRLVLGIFVCLSIGSLVTSAFFYSGPAGKAHAGFFALLFGSVVLLITALVLLSQFRPDDAFMGRVLFMLGSVFVGLALGGWAQKIAGHPPERSSGQQMIIAEAGLLFFLLGFVRAHHVSWAEAFGFTHRPRQAILVGATIACVFLPLAEALQLGSAVVLTHFRIEPHEQQAVHALRVTASSWNRFFLAVLAIGLAPIVEEVLFRGILYPTVKQAGFPRLAWWGVAILFACVHMNLLTFIPLLALALVLTELYERTDNLLANITAHALFNGMNFALLYLFPPPGT